MSDELRHVTIETILVDYSRFLVLDELVEAAGLSADSVNHTRREWESELWPGGILIYHHNNNHSMSKKIELAELLWQPQFIALADKLDCGAR